MIGQISVSVGVDEKMENGKWEMKIYPNPSNGNITVSVNAMPLQGLTLVVSDVAGRKLKDYFFVENTFSIPASELDNGFYFLSIYKNNVFLSSAKLIVSR